MSVELPLCTALAFAMGVFLGARSGLEVLARVGTSLASGVPVFQVRCRACGTVYRLTAWRSNIARSAACTSCSAKARKAPR